MNVNVRAIIISLIWLFTLGIPFESIAQKNDVAEWLSLLQTSEPIASEKIELIEKGIDSISHSGSSNDALHLLNKIANYHLFTAPNPLRAETLLQKHFPLIARATNQQEVGVFYTNLIEAKIYNHDQRAALQTIQQALAFHHNNSDSTSYDYAYAYLKKAETEMALNNMSESMHSFKKAEELFSFQRDTLFLLWTKNGLGSLYSMNGLREKGKQHRAFIYEHQKKGPQVAAIARIRDVLDAQFENQTEQELQHIREALKLNYEDADVYPIVRTLVLSFAVSAYARNQKIDSAEIFAQELKQFSSNLDQNAFLNNYYQLGMAQLAFQKKNYNAALKNVNEVWSKIKNTPDSDKLLETEFLRYNIYKVKGDMPAAFTHFEKYSRIRDSINKIQSKRKFAIVQAEFETKQKDLIIAQQEKDISLLNAQNRIKVQWIIFGGLGLILLFSAIFFWRVSIVAKAREELQHSFSQNLIKTQEEERARLALELHDSVGQQLMLLTRKTKQFKNENVTHLASTTLSNLRSISRGLHPATLKHLGFTQGVKNYLADIDAENDIFVTYEIDDIDIYLDEHQALHLYRIIQEVTSNIIKHSQAQAARYTVENRVGQIKVIIKDNGKGFDYVEKVKKSKSFGMKSLAERAKILNATFQIKSIINEGTTVSLVLPKPNFSS